MRHQTPQHATHQNIENKENLNKDVAENVAMPQQDATARDTKRYSVPRCKIWQHHNLKNGVYLGVY
jgi:hypothetical protein